MTYIPANDSSDGVSKVIYQSKEFRKNWARLIQKIYHVDPLLCPKCLGSMKIISFIEDEDVISKILKQNVCFIIKKERFYDQKKG